MIKADSLACRRGGRAVFRDVTFAVADGGLLLVRGANGSGKSTLLRAVAGLVACAAGTIAWGGADDPADRPPLHYVGHLDALKPGLTVREMLDYWRALRGACGGLTRAMLEAFAIADLIDLPLRVLSAGQKKRVSLTRLLLDPAPLWVLDEPTVALDRAAQGLLGNVVARHRAAGGTVVASIHEMIDWPDAASFDLDAHKTTGTTGA